MTKPEYLEKAQYWAEARCFDESTKAEVSSLLRSGNQTEIEERFRTELEFGTGGLRGLVGVGTSRLNTYTVRKATTALSLYLKEYYKRKSDIKVAISFDSRLSSKDFSKIASGVLAYHGIYVYLTKNLRPTPALSFMVRHFKCQAGICITASHNPPEYNGYKVYWEDGGQIVRPHDKKIIQNYNLLTDYNKLESLGFEEAQSKRLVVYCDEELDFYYREMAKKVSYRKLKNDSHKIVYSPLHGSGGTLLPDVLKDRGFENVLLVPEQKDPDGLFPTVKSPNPEDDGAFELAKAYADKKGAKISLVTDPDADRLGVCVKEEGKWRSLSGNQIATLLTHYIFEALKEQGESFEKSYIVKTVVTTDLLETIARSFNCKTYVTLTGFKWIADVILREEAEGNTFLCGGEESLGFLAKDFVRDKDAVTTGALMCEVFSFCEEKGKTLFSYLDEIYAKYGYHYESLQTLTLKGLKGQARIQELMTYFRDLREKDLFSFTLVKKLDYLEQKKLNFGETVTEEVFQDFPKSDVLQFYFKNGFSFTVRPSGTEAKIKFYFMHKDLAPSSSSNLIEAKSRLQKEVEFFWDQLMRKITN